MKYIIFAYIVFLSTLNLSAKIYENGEDKKINRWETLSFVSKGTILNQYDKLKKSRVIKFNGEGTKSAYILTINSDFKNKPFIWEMKYSEDFVIFISLETRLGIKYLVYTSGNKNSYMQYGLGTHSRNGKWQKFSRNLEKDLQYFDNRNSILKIKSFVIRGSGSIDNIGFLEEKKIKKSVKKIDTKYVPKKKTNTLPIITIKGNNPLYLKINEAYIEPGVSAKDKEDGDIVVISSEDIDREKEGRYAVIYMATDSMGNIAIDKRVVIVGDVSIEDESLNTQSMVKSKEDSLDAQYRLEERELEIAEWERALQFREKEISQREKSLLK
jgi:hypothetical protein